MRFSRTRYVTVCQQVLAAATVTAIGLSASGVMTLDLVGPQATVPGVGSGPSAGSSHDLRSAVHTRSAYVDTGPVTPRVHEVRLAGARTPDRAAGGGHAARPGDDQDGAGPSARVTTATNRAGRTGSGRIEGMPVAVLSPPEPVTGFATVGVTWSPRAHVPPDGIVVQVRTRDDGAWSRWQSVEYHADHAPDAEDTDDSAHARPGTDATVVGDVDAVQMRAATATGQAPADIRLTLVDPGRDHLTEQAPAIDTAKLPRPDTAADAAGTAPVESTGGTDAPADRADRGDLALRAMRTAPKPKIYSRAQWGANEKLREQNNTDYGTIKTGFVHHTVNANDYTRKEVPAIIRGIYAYHVEGRGWRDIGYNFLVDRFGRIWEGRWGGVGRPVIGAHTYGFNDVSFAMSAIGNYQIKRPSKAIVNAFARLFAWKLSRYDIRADARGLRIKGTTLHAINGHRDVSATACPGKYLYAKLPEIRKKARRIQRQAQHPPDPVVATHGGVTATATGGTGEVHLVGYGSNPRAATRAPAAGSYFGLSLSVPNTFTRLVLEDCDLRTGTSLEWWDADAGKKGRWRPVRGDPVDNDGLPKCLTVTLDNSTSPTLDQLAGTTFAVVDPTRVTRVSGSNRYATAATVAGRQYRAGVSRVYVTSGAGFADALTAGVPAGIHHDPVLLVRPHRIPKATRLALEKLAPKRVVVVGGTDAVGKRVAGSLAKLTTGSVTRLGGADRYATAARVARTTFADGAQTAYVASGEDFPDALSGVALAAVSGAPILLTRSGSLPPVTARALESLGVDRISVLGGPGAVSTAVVQRLGRFGSTDRISGTNRYRTSARIAAAFRGKSPGAVYLTTGDAFADAITAGAVAGGRGVPVLLSRSGSLPPATRAELLALGSRNVTVLGGVAAVAESVLGALRAALYGQ